MKVLITGGSGDIAQSIAKKLKENKYTVLTPGKDELDVTDPGIVLDYMNRNTPDILINNAGYIYPAPIVPSSLAWFAEFLKDLLAVGSFVDDEWQKQINVNLIGPYLCSKYALLNACQLIINIGSSAGSKGKANWSAYCAAKAGVERLTESLHEEGHLAVCLAIGRTATKMRKELFGEEDPHTLLTPEAIALEILGIIEAPELFSGRVIPFSVGM